MKTIGYMLNTYEEYGPYDIAVFPADADLSAAVIEYCESLRMPFEEPSEILAKWLEKTDREKNIAYDLSLDWGGVQITELAVK